MIQNAGAKEVPLEIQQEHACYQTLLINLMKDVETPEGYGLFPGEHCCHLSYPGLKGLVVVDYQRKGEHAHPEKGLPDWRNVVYYWFRKIKRTDLADEFKRKV